MALVMHPLALSLFEACLDDQDFWPTKSPCGQSKRRRRAGLTSSDDGWNVTIPLPGLTASDVTVEGEISDESRKLYIHALPTADVAYTLSAEADLGKAKAILTDGELTVSIPRLPETSTEIPIAETAATAEQEHEEVTLLVPGFNSGTLTITANAAKRTLLVEGKTNTSSYRRVLTFSAKTDVEHASASCVDGVLTLCLPRRHTLVTPVEVEHAAALEPSDDMTLLFRLPLPGVSAHRVSLNVAEGTLKICIADQQNETEQRTVRRIVLPTGVVPEGLRASCRDGMLIVLAPKPVPPARFVISCTPGGDATAPEHQQ